MQESLMKSLVLYFTLSSINVRHANLGLWYSIFLSWLGRELMCQPFGNKVDIKQNFIAQVLKVLKTWAFFTISPSIYFLFFLSGNVEARLELFFPSWFSSNNFIRNHIFIEVNIMLLRFSLKAEVFESWKYFVWHIWAELGIFWVRTQKDLEQGLSESKVLFPL